MTQRTSFTLGIGAFLSLTIFFSSCKKEERTNTLPRQLQAARRFADSIGIDTTHYIVASAQADTVAARAALEKLITEIHYGHKPASQSFAKLPEKVDAEVIGKLAQSVDVVGALKTDAATFAPYQALLARYNEAKKTASPTQLNEIRETLNFYRYLNRFGAEKFIVVNIPAARLAVFDKTGKRELPMDVIVGKAAKATPRFNCYLTEIVAYPYWNVPEGIAMKEIVPKVKENLSYLDSQNMEILDRREQPVDPESIDWSSVSAANFPYRFRQRSGCNNSLGLIKFVLNGPPAIYLHDTNARELFDQTTDHWRSHGCIRVERPVELANFVLGTPKFDQGFYNRCLTDQTPSSFKLPKPYPVFVTYNLADVDEQGQLVYYKDVYKKS
ncbi:L,D-transpeptidase family protein [Fibrella forsythiae]|uniref:L,D-transpeptidase family protein n=1 Tax=Fibrella forsythiae TaxID=2817061 RepID=A0ABS3JDN4_9BACT|nr:L,D-transpeptidase family protein [Fibrella forsythiae]MBO0948110.1 L,D-transpeptidase family protein [Fibrella forsythiae]